MRPDGQEQDRDDCPAQHRRLQDVGPHHRPQSTEGDIRCGEDPDADQRPEVLRLAQSHHRLQREGDRVEHRTHPAQGVHAVETRADPPRGQAEPPAQILVSAADLQPHEQRYEDPAQDGRDDERDEQDRQVEAEVLVGPTLREPQVGDRAEAGGEHRDADRQPVHLAAADEVVFVILLSFDASDRQAEDHRQIREAHTPVDVTQFRRRHNTSIQVSPVWNGRHAVTSAALPPESC